MDNRETVPGYKVYLDPETGEQPPLHVAFLGIRPDPDEHVSGVTVEVTGDELAVLDARERNYDRHDVTELVDADIDGRVWTYVGSAAGRQRLATGRAHGTAVVSEGYLEGVRRGMAALGLRDELPLDLPVVPLLRRDVGA